MDSWRREWDSNYILIIKCLNTVVRYWSENDGILSCLVVRQEQNHEDQSSHPGPLNSRENETLEAARRSRLPWSHKSSAFAPNFPPSERELGLLM